MNKTLNAMSETVGILAWAKRAIKAKSVNPNAINACLGVLMNEGQLAELPTVQKELQIETSKPGSHAYPGILGLFGEPEYFDSLCMLAFGSSNLDGINSLNRKVSVVPALGGTHGLLMAFRLVSGPIFCSKPYWPNYDSIAQFVGKEVLDFDMTGSFEQQVSERKVEEFNLLINDPASNPSGESLSDTDYDTLIKCLNQLNSKGVKTTIIFDPAYMAYAKDGLDAAAKRTLLKLLKEAKETRILCAWSGTKHFLEYNDRSGALFAWGAISEVEPLKPYLMTAVRGSLSQVPSRTQKALLNIVEKTLSEQVDSERKILIDKLFECGEEAYRVMSEIGLKHLGSQNYEGGFMLSIPVKNADMHAENLASKDFWVVPIDNAILRIALSSLQKKEVEPLLKAVLEEVEGKQ